MSPPSLTSPRPALPPAPTPPPALLRAADKPNRFDVIVTLNLYGDVLSDIAAQVAGSVGLGASANIGDHVAMFEAIHGSAPDLAGRDIANPSGLLLAAVQMLLHIDHPRTAAKVRDGSDGSKGRTGSTTPVGVLRASPPEPHKSDPLT